MMKTPPALADFSGAPMNINAERFFALTALLAAPLVAAPACVINDTDDDTGSNTNANTESTNPSTTVGTETTNPSTTAGTDSTTVGTGDTTGDDPTGGTTDDPTGDTTAGTTGGNELGNCCAPDGMAAGCEVPEVQDCVCEADPYCCEELWDENCAAEVNSLGCGECELPPQAFDCYCLASCDDVPVDTPFQVCGTDFDSASAAGQTACEEQLGTDCTTFSCDECDCSTAEVAKITCE
jgi:hypothetical protein